MLRNRTVQVAQIRAEVRRIAHGVNWDQRGARKSFAPGADPATLTIDQFVDDALALIEALLQRFGQKKLLLVGQSWGSLLAMRVAAARPDLLHAVVGMGQVVDMKRGEDISYQYVLGRARAGGNRRAIRELERIGPPPYEKDGLFVQRRWLSHYKGFSYSMDEAACAAAPAAGLDVQATVAVPSLQVLPSSVATHALRPRASLDRAEEVAWDRWPRGGGDAHLTLFLCLREQGFGRQSRDDSSSGIDGFRNRRRKYCRGF